MFKTRRKDQHGVNKVARKYEDRQIIPIKRTKLQIQPYRCVNSKLMGKINTRVLLTDEKAVEIYNKQLEY